MGQKINPIGLRLGINRGWDSTWFAKKKDFGRYLIEDFKVRNYIKKNIVNSGVSEIIIERSSKKCTVSIHTSRPGFVIGKKGADIEKIKKNITKITGGDVNVNIKEIKKPELNSNLVAENNESDFVFMNTSIALSISLWSLNGEVACKNTIISGKILWLDCINSILIPKDFAWISQLFLTSSRVALPYLDSSLSPRRFKLGPFIISIFFVI